MAEVCAHMRCFAAHVRDFKSLSAQRITRQKLGANSVWASSSPIQACLPSSQPTRKPRSTSPIQVSSTLYGPSCTFP